MSFQQFTTTFVIWLVMGTSSIEGSGAKGLRDMLASPAVYPLLYSFVCHILKPLDIFCHLAGVGEEWFLKRHSLSCFGPLSSY